MFTLNKQTEQQMTKSKFTLMKEHIALREKAWNTKYSFFDKLRGYVEMGVFISPRDIELASNGLTAMIESSGDVPQ